jgi:hypothetical protein
MAAPALSLRERILQHLATTLAGVTTGAGYATTLVGIVRGHLSPLETFIFPTASIIPVDDDEEWTPQTAQHQLRSLLRVWIDDVPVSAPSTLEALLADISAVLQVDTTRGGAAEYTLCEGTQYLYQQATERLCGADVRLRVDFKTSIADPRVGV